MIGPLPLLPPTAAAHAPSGAPTRLVVERARTALVRRQASARVIVTGHYADGTARDLTHSAALTASDPAVVAVESGGRITPRGDGSAEVIARVGGVEARAAVEV